MQTNPKKLLLWSAFWLLNNLSVILAAPQQGPALDIGIIKIAFDTENGFAVRKDINIDTPFFKVRKTGEIGFGSPMVSSSDSDSDEDSDEDQSIRKKRAIVDHNSLGELNFIRKKRTPCYGGQARPTQAPPDGVDVVEARRRRNVARKLMQMKRKASGGKAKSKLSKRQKRTRRQAEIENFNEIQDKNGGKTFSDHIDQTLQKVNGMWESIVRTTEQLVHAIKKTFDNAANSIKNAVRPSAQQPEEI